MASTGIQGLTGLKAGKTSVAPIRTPIYESIKTEPMQWQWAKFFDDMQTTVSTGSMTPGPVGPVGPAGAQGKDGKDGKDGISGTTGLQGATGLQGVTGIAGSSNFADTTSFSLIDPNSFLYNERDDALFVSVQGNTGVWIQVGSSKQGIQGVTGVGATGIQGLQGQTGMIGPSGLTGADGVQGLTGADGLTGAQGLTGVTYGATGLQGPTGIAGLAGTQGTTGLANFLVDGYPALGDTPVLLWNQRDEALFAGISGIDHWVQISTGALQGVTGVSVPGYTGLQGPKGATGVQGIQGIQGATGAAGTIGVNGATGLKGATGVGITGPKGATGVQGEEGLMGLQGPTGLNGATGIAGAGFTGLQGTTGLANFIVDGYPILGETPVLLWNQRDEALFCGISGIDHWVQISTGTLQGPTGPIGPSGGVQGVTGPAGIGATGLMGPTGVRGIQGQIGVQGNTGVGIQGETGIDGIAGPMGMTGAGIQGATGVIGPKGATGVQGLIGAQGATGTQGIQGITGATGLQGSTGLVGPVGAKGNTGVQGDAGVKGATGVQGPFGIQGLQGFTGVQGLQGIQGNTGAKGSIGAQGATGVGATGLMGPMGLIGATGIAGLQGNTGVDGIQGATGTAGTLGQTGPQGPTGLKGTYALTNPHVPYYDGTNLQDSIIHSVSGMIGIDSTNPHTKLEMLNGSMVIFGLTGANPCHYDNSSTPTPYGAGNYMMYVGESGAFRVGYYNGWELAPETWGQGVGAQSFAAGIDNYAAGSGAVSLGYLNIATGGQSIALGSRSTAYIGANAGIAIGRRAAVSQSYGMGLGHMVYSAAPGAIVIGSGDVVNETFYLQNDKTNSIMIGAGSLRSSIFVAPGSTGIAGKVGIDSTSPVWPLDVHGGINTDTGYYLNGVPFYGATGLQGATGIQGIQGVTGMTGAQGATGVKGATGIQGVTGLIGATGLQGQTGIIPISDQYTYPAVTSTVSLHYNERDDAFFAGVTGSDGKWIQISAGSLQGPRGATGIQGAPTSLNYSITAPIGTVSTGIMGMATMPGPAELTSWSLLADTACNISVLIEKANYSSYPVFSGVAGSTGIGIYGGVKNHGVPDGSWELNLLDAGDIVRVTLTGSDASASKVSFNLGYTNI